MRRYAIWDKTSPVITPSGAVYTAEEWKAKYPVAALDNVAIVCSAGVVNGGYFGILQQMVDTYSSEGCDFTDCETGNDVLQAIEDFEDAREATREEQTASNQDIKLQQLYDQQRIADALEDLVVLNMPDVEEEAE